METFFVLVLLALLAAGVWGALAAARRFEVAVTAGDAQSEDE
ncbi:MAG: hypothetical protein ACTHJM_13975 [Marmoricola sp.]